MKIRSTHLAAALWVLVMCYASWLLLLLSIPYISMKPGVDFLKTKALVYHLIHWRIAFYVHVFSSLVVIVTGIFQFIPLLNKQFPKLHKSFGIIYISVLLLLAAPSGLILALYANGGCIAQIGFTGLAVLWLYFTLKSTIALMKRNFVLHSQHITRSYALTLAAVTLRLYGYLFDVLKLDFNPIVTYQFLAYVSWIPNLIIAELLIRNRLISKLMTKNNY